MDFLELAQKRYSSREYTGEPVSDECIRKILEAGRASPTARNGQPVEVIAVRSEEGLRKAEEGCNPYGAPLVLIVCSDTEKSWVRGYDGMNTAEIDAAIVTAQMMYEATALGLGTVWICLFDPAVIRRNFGIPDNVLPVNILAVGHPADSTSRNHGNRKPMDEFVRFA